MGRNSDRPNGGLEISHTCITSFLQTHAMRVLSDEDQLQVTREYRVAQFSVLLTGFVLHFSLAVISMMFLLVETHEAPVFFVSNNEVQVHWWRPGWVLPPTLFFLSVVYYLALLLRWNNYVHFSHIPFRSSVYPEHNDPSVIRYTSVWVFFLSCFDCARRTQDAQDESHTALLSSSGTSATNPVPRRPHSMGPISNPGYELYIDFAETLYFYTEAIAFPLFMIPYVPIFGATSVPVLLLLAAVAFSMPTFGLNAVRASRAYSRGGFSYVDSILTLYSLFVSGMFMAFFILLYVGKSNPTFSDGLATFGSSGIFFVIALSIQKASQSDPELPARKRLSLFLGWSLVRECANIVKNMLFTWFLLYKYSPIL